MHYENLKPWQYVCANIEENAPNRAFKIEFINYTSHEAEIVSKSNNTRT